MSFQNIYLTKKGITLCTKLLTGDSLVITGIRGGDGKQTVSDYTEQTNLEHSCVEFSLYKNIVYDEQKPNCVTIPIYYENKDLTESIALTEIGVFAQDPDDGEILLCILPEYDMPLGLPSIAEGRLELTMELILELSLSPNVSISMPASIIYLTKPEADALYASKKHRHDADSIDESNGQTTEAWQRHQDAQIEALQLKTDSGTTSAETIQTSTVPSANWEVIDYWGIYDKQKGIFYA